VHSCFGEFAFEEVAQSIKNQKSAIIEDEQKMKFKSDRSNRARKLGQTNQGSQSAKWLSDCLHWFALTNAADQERAMTIQGQSEVDGACCIAQTNHTG
jgi:hypothetical protein